MYIYVYTFVCLCLCKCRDEFYTKTHQNDVYVSVCISRCVSQSIFVCR